MTLRRRLRHAFAVDPPGPARPNGPQREIVDAFCRWFARRHLTTPGLIALEMARPLNFISSQAMHFFSPGVWAIAPEQLYRNYQQFAAFLEQRGSIEYIARRIEHFEDLYERRERESRRRPPGGAGGDASGPAPPP